MLHPGDKLEVDAFGDLIIEVRLMLPKILDERSKELLREFGRINGESVRESLPEAGSHTDAPSHDQKP